MKFGNPFTISTKLFTYSPPLLSRLLTRLLSLHQLHMFPPLNYSAQFRSLTYSADPTSSLAAPYYRRPLSFTLNSTSSACFSMNFYPMVLNVLFLAHNPSLSYTDLMSSPLFLLLNLFPTWHHLKLQLIDLLSCTCYLPSTDLYTSPS